MERVLQPGIRVDADNTAGVQQRLLIVDSSKLERRTACRILGDHFKIVEATDGEEAWSILNNEAPFSLVISSMDMPGMDAFELLERIRQTHLPRSFVDLPVIIITDDSDTKSIKQRAILAGATDFIGRPFDGLHLLRRAQAHAIAHGKAHALREETLALEDASASDPLTGLANELSFMERGYQQLAYAVRHNTRLSVFRIEVDNFGCLYIAKGDTAAEHIIKTIAYVLTSTIRREDTAARIGRARFALLLPGLNNAGVHHLADRIRNNLDKHLLEQNDPGDYYTISIGVSAMGDPRDTHFDDLLSIANSRLVHAIACGGNQAIYEGEDHTVLPVQPDSKTSTDDQPEAIDEEIRRLNPTTSR